MKHAHVPWHSWLVPSLLVVMMLWFAVSASAEPVMRVVTFTAGPGTQAKIFPIADEANKVYTAAKGLQWVKFWFDPFSGEYGGASLWDSYADVEAFLNSDAYRAQIEKLRPFVRGVISDKVYQVYEPKK